MPSFYQSVQSQFIQAPPERIYDALADWALRSQWRKGIQVEWKGNSQAFVGQEVTFKIKGLIFCYRIRFKVTGLEPPYRLYMEYFGKSLEGRHAIELTPEKEGCRVAFHWMKVNPVGVLAKLYFALGFGMRDHRIRVQETLGMLKEYVKKD